MHAVSYMQCHADNAMHTMPCVQCHACSTMHAVPQMQVCLCTAVTHMRAQTIALHIRVLLDIAAYKITSVLTHVPMHDYGNAGPRQYSEQS